jgi:hypothetical protein
METCSVSVAKVARSTSWRKKTSVCFAMPCRGVSAGVSVTIHYFLQLLANFGKNNQFCAVFKMWLRIALYILKSVIWIFAFWCDQGLILKSLIWISAFLCD